MLKAVTMRCMLTEVAVRQIWAQPMKKGLPSIKSVIKRLVNVQLKVNFNSRFSSFLDSLGHTSTRPIMLRLMAKSAFVVKAMYQLQAKK